MDLARTALAAMRTAADGSQRTVETLAGAYESFYQGMYEAIADGKEVPVKPQEAVDVIRVIELALRSHHERRTIDAAQGEPHAG